MGRYLKKQKKWSFESPGHMVQCIARSHKDDPHWTSMVRAAQDFLDERKVPKNRVRRNDLMKIIHHSSEPHKLVAPLMHDLRRAARGKKRGAGIFDAFWAIAAEARHLLGIDAFIDSIGLGYKHIPLSEKEEVVAAALQQAYKSIEERKDRVGDLKRLPGYDTDQIAVWEQPDGQLLVTVRGTKMNASDLGNDAQIMGGGEVRSTELQTLLQDLNSRDAVYDIAGHSLATQFIQNAVRDGDATNADEILLFNPASSPFQKSSYLTEEANDPRYTWFINQGDVVSRGLYQKMNSETLGSDRIHLGSYRWDPLHAHFLDQWVPEQAEEEIEKEEEQAEEQDKAKEKEAEEAAAEQGEEARKSGWTVNFNK